MLTLKVVAVISRVHFGTCSLDFLPATILRLVTIGWKKPTKLVPALYGVDQHVTVDGYLPTSRLVLPVSKNVRARSKNGGCVPSLHWPNWRKISATRP
jgi:hypothetical protein